MGFNSMKEIYKNLLGQQDSLLGLREKIFREGLGFQV